MAQKLTAKNGRPSVYTEAIAEEILGRMSRGETLTSICREPGMPVISTVSLWAIDDKPKGFSERYARARQMQADAIAEGAVDIADDDPAADAAKTRLKVDTRKWLASKINPAKFGERTRITVDDPVKALANLLNVKPEDIPC